MSASRKRQLHEEKAAKLTEKQLQAQKEAQKLKLTSAIFVGAISLILVVALVVFGVNTYRGSGISERNTDALVIGERTISAAELNYFFMDRINELYAQFQGSYGNYADMYLRVVLGLDLTKPLDQQLNPQIEGTTYAEYFTDSAVDSAVASYVAYDKAIAEGYTLTDQDKINVESILNELTTAAESGGYFNLKAYLKAMYGKGATVDSYKKYLELTAVAGRYINDYYDSFADISLADLVAYDAEHYNEYSSYSYLAFSLTADDFIAHAEGETSHNHSDAEVEQAKAEAKAAAEALLAAAPADEEAFNAAIQALETSADYSEAKCNSNLNVLYSDVGNSEAAEWLADNARKAGDITLIESGNSFTLVVFQSRNDNEMKLVDVRHVLKAFSGTKDSITGETNYPEEGKDAVRQAAQELYDVWLEEDGTEAGLMFMAMSSSDDTGSSSNGGLYENVKPGDMVAPFEEWCFDESHEVGDHGLLETEYGVHIMYLSGRSDMSYRHSLIKEDLQNDKYEAWYNALKDEVTHELLTTEYLSTSTPIRTN